MAVPQDNAARDLPQGRVVRVSGPLVVAVGLEGTRMYELVRIGEQRLFGEVIEIRGDDYSIQVYEETEGIGPGEPVFPEGQPLSVELGPGLVSSIYDGVQRPLEVLLKDFGEYIVRGADAPALDRERKWAFEPRVEVGAEVGPGRHHRHRPGDQGHRAPRHGAAGRQGQGQEDRARRGHRHRRRRRPGDRGRRAARSP